MELWITADEIIQRGILNKETLVSLVRKKQLPVYDEDEKPVDLISLENQFNDIARMIKEPIQGMVQKNVLRYNELLQQEQITYATVPAMVAPFIGHHDEWTNKNGKHNTPRIPWNKLHNALANKTRPIIPKSQYEEIMDGWGKQQITEVIFESLFRENEVLAVSDLNTEQRQTSPHIDSICAKLQQHQPVRTRLPNWEKIEKTAGMSKKTIKKAESKTNMKAVIHHEGNKVWAFEDEVIELAARYGAYKERKVKEKKAANKQK